MDDKSSISGDSKFSKFTLVNSEHCENIPLTVIKDSPL